MPVDPGAHNVHRPHRALKLRPPQPEKRRTSPTAGEICRRDRLGGLIHEYHVGPSMRRLEIFDRVGGGDSLASGLIYGLLAGLDVNGALAYGVAHGALAMTTPGDTSMATLSEVERLVAGASARVIR